MIETNDESIGRSDTRTTDVYLPAVSLPPRFVRLERLSTRLFGRRRIGGLRRRVR
jgi:hypothetical protein